MTLKNTLTEYLKTGLVTSSALKLGFKQLFTLRSNKREEIEIVRSVISRKLSRNVN